MGVWCLFVFYYGNIYSKYNLVLKNWITKSEFKLNMMLKLEFVWHPEKYLSKCCFMKYIILYCEATVIQLVQIKMSCRID